MGSRKCTWANVNMTNNSTKPLDFNSIMSEQMAVKLQLEEDIKLNNDEEEAKRLSSLINGEQDVSVDDFEFARIMQEQFDKEELDYLESVKQAGLNVEVEKLNLQDNDEICLNESSSSEENEEFKREWDSFEKAEKQATSLSKYEKHDLTHAGRMNACKLTKMNISTGDIGNHNYDMRLNNNVYNSLKTHVKKEKKRFARLNEKKSTAEGVMDDKSKLVLFKLINAEIIDEVNGIISTGKESNLYHGIGGNMDKKIDTGEIAIKIFKTSLNEFKNRSEYIRNDYRFHDRMSKSNSHKTITLWAEKEMNNLNRIKKAGILCPNVIMLKKHILVMNFLGNNGVAAPTLREAIHLNSTQLERAKIETVDIIKNLYEKCDLVHADLSEYNLIYFNGRVYVVDVGQSVLKGHPNALKFLLRDCQNVSRFFQSRGLTQMLSGSELFCEITGVNKSLINCSDDIEILQKIRDLEKDNRIFSKDLNKTQKEDLFDEMFNKSLNEREFKMSQDDKMSIKNSCIE